jgi:hypothetical protein
MCGWAALPVTIDVIVECQFFIPLDRAIRKNAHPNVLPNRPLCDVAVRIARVIRETADPTTLRCVNELQEKPGLHAKRAGVGRKKRFYSPRPSAAS